MERTQKTGEAQAKIAGMFRGFSTRMRGTSTITSSSSAKLAPSQRTPEEAVRSAVKLLGIRRDDVVYDVGCGKGYFLAEAAKSTKSFKGLIGVEYDRSLVERAKRYIADAGLSHRVRVVEADATKYDFSDATAMFLYLVPEGLKKIRSPLENLLQRDGRIVSYVFSIPGMKATQTVLTKGNLALRLYTKRSLSSKATLAVHDEDAG
eukprot:g843.t1